MIVLKLTFLFKKPINSKIFFKDFYILNQVNFQSSKNLSNHKLLTPERWKIYILVLKMEASEPK